jgi:hypothetical protein
LVQNCTTRNGRHDYVNGSRTCGPNVFYNSTATIQHSDIGPHHRWATGILFDNLTGNGNMNVQNRLVMGSGHGWAGGQIMFWNCNASRMVIQDPPGDQLNWAIGCICPDITGNGDATTEPLGVIQSQGTRISAIPSLFIAQLNQRLYGTTPVELVQFELRKKRQSVILNWATASEKDNQYFVVEHATNGIDFTALETVSSKGNGSAFRKYSYEYKNPTVGINYYRLKQVDIDGKYTYSDIKTIDMPRKLLSLTSTLISDVLHIFLAGSVPVEYRIVNTSGQQVATGKSIGSTKIGLSKHPVGWYYVITGNGESASFFKVH